MSFQSADPSFSQILVVTNYDGSMNFIFLIKTPNYQPKNDEQILALLKVSLVQPPLNETNLEPCFPL